MKKINLLAIRIDGGTQARLSLNQDVVSEYSQHMLDGDVFPPVTVFHDGSEYWLADGFHRYFATKANGSTTIEADVREGTQDDAILYAFSANGRRGLSMSAEDNRNIIKRMLDHPVWGQWTNAEIARHVGVSKMTVGRVKATLNPQPDESTVKKYKTKTGEHAMQTKRAAPKKEEPPEEPQEDHLDSLADTITTLEQENQMLKDKIAIGQWDATEIEKVDIQETVEQLREQIRVLEIDNKALRESRDMYQARNAELMKTVKSLQAKLKAIEGSS